MRSIQFQPIDAKQYSYHLNNLRRIYSELLDTHRALLAGLHSIQLEEIPVISSLCGVDRFGIDRVDWQTLYKHSLVLLDQAEAFFRASSRSSFSLQAFIEVGGAS